MTDLVLAIDLGTGSVKTGLVTEDGVLRAQASAPYAVTSPHPGWSETDPGAWWSGVVQAVRAVLSGGAGAAGKGAAGQGAVAGQVRAIGFSGQMHGVVLADPTGRTLRPALLWSDTRSAAQLQAYDRLPPAWRSRLGSPPVTGFAGPSLLWLRDHERAVYASARFALQPKDWLRLHLTGQAASEPSDAAGTLLYDLERGDWDGPVVERLGLNLALLPPLQASGALAGHLRADRSAELGLPPHLPVVAGAADTAAALLGAGLRPGEAQLTVGTGAQLVLASAQRPPPRPALHMFRDAQAGYYTLAAVQNAGTVLEWVRVTLRLTWPELYAAAQAAQSGDSGDSGDSGNSARTPPPLFLPYLTGDRTPHLNPHARAGWLGLGAAHDHRHLAYAAFEGVALSIAQAAAALELPAGQPLKLAGGGTLEPWWRSLLADALGRELHVIETPSASLLGAARLAWQGLGRPLTAAPPVVTDKVFPHPDRLPEVRRQQFAQAYQALSAWFRAG